jgi:hypothetical protein
MHKGQARKRPREDGGGVNGHISDDDDDEEESRAGAIKKKKARLDVYGDVGNGKKKKKSEKAVLISQTALGPPDMGMSAGVGAGEDETFDISMLSAGVSVHHQTKNTNKKRRHEADLRTASPRGSPVLDVPGDAQGRPSPMEEELEQVDSQSRAGAAQIGMVGMSSRAKPTQTIRNTVKRTCSPEAIDISTILASPSGLPTRVKGPSAMMLPLLNLDGPVTNLDTSQRADGSPKKKRKRRKKRKSSFGVEAAPRI